MLSRFITKLTGIRLVDQTRNIKRIIRRPDDHDILLMSKLHNLLGNHDIQPTMIQLTFWLIA